MKKLDDVQIHNMSLVDRLNDYQYLWDGTEEWGLCAQYNSQSSLKIIFAGSQATIAEIIALRKLLVGYRNTPVIEIKSFLKNKKEVELGILSSMEANRMINHAKQLNLEIVAIDVSVTDYLPIHLKNNTALIIEDDDLARRAIKKMLESGIAVTEHIEID
jgi:hypothetical protein